MSTTSPRQTIVVPINLGAASNFDRDIFPLVSVRKKDKLGQGDFLLDATLDEMLKITSMGTDPRQWEDAIATAKARYDQLKLQQTRLEERSKSKTPLQALNLRKTFSDYRAIRLFRDAAKTLYKETRSTSEQMRRTINRDLLSEVPQEDVEPADDNIPPGATVTGLAVTVDGSMDEDTERSIITAANSLVNPFADPLRSVTDSLFRDWDTSSAAGGSTAPSDGASDISAALLSSSPTSPGSGASVNYNINIIRNSIISPNSILRGSTLNQDGSGNSGSQS
ncbi:hypothetical protein J3R83DRAFT_3248 [Lanmaoa asiatica]|nr:hypothetical protein J3R83DRAFT_3248 [Lanmaoa asiatica]